MSPDYLFLKANVSVTGVHGARNQIGNAGFPCPAGTTGDSNVSMQDLLNGDGQPDIYIYNFPGGHSGKFYINPENGLPVLIDKKEEITFQNQNGWVATMLDGTKYIFQAQEIASSGANHVGYTWKLTQIVLNNGKTINFTYTSGQYYWQTSSEAFHTSYPFGILGMPGIDAPLPGASDFNCVPTSSTTQNQVQTIAQITTDNEIITFNYGTRTDLPVPSIQSVDIRDAVTNQLKKSFELNYTYFANSTVGGNYLDPSYNPNYSYPPSGNISQRLKLVSVQEVGYNSTQQQVLNPPYQFSYDESNSLPLKTSFTRDYWGYYNGANNNKLTPDVSYLYYSGQLSPQFPYETLSTVNGADRAPNKAYMTAGMLTKVQYPTVGWTQFNYEPNTFSNFDYPDADKNRDVSSCD